jgi:stage II sporulation protein D
MSILIRTRLCAVCLLTLTIATLLSVPLSAHALDPDFTFNGGGWGHGIGLSQYGAQGYAKQGWKYDAILKHYYQGTKIVTKPTAKVRVNLEDGASSRTQWRIKAGSTTALTVAQESDTSIRYPLDSTNSYWITTSGSNTRVCADDGGKPGKVLKTFSGACYATAGGFVQILDTSGPYNYKGIVWRGTIHFQPYNSTTSKAINYVDIEQYLYGVVPRESPSSWHAEALKSQAVAARSYAYQDAVDKRVIYCTTKSQVYNGHSRPGYSHEAASTNSAITATAGELVWYGSETKPVKTYFSSSSGGHTANIEDVWGGTAKPYYTSVEDADQANPYYTWTVGPYSATYVAGKIRALDIARGGGLEYSVASPAVVTAIVTERAKSGHAHHVNVTWSNGKTYRIMGDTLRSAMGMKSTNYGVDRTYAVATTTRYQNSNTKLAWTGYWKVQTRTDLSGGTLQYSSIKNASVKATFSGTGVVWTGTKSPKFGKAGVYVDGKLVKTVDLYGTSTAYRQTLFKDTNLSPGAHTIEIKVLREKRSASSGYFVGIDTIDVLNGSMSQTTAALKRFEDTDSHFALLGTWKTYSKSAYSAGRHVYTVEPNARFYATFYGSEIRWIGNTSPGYGAALVSIDGGPAEKVVITTDTYGYRKVLFARSGLSQDRSHTIVIEALGKGSGGTAGYTAIDALDVRGGWVIAPKLPTVTVEDASTAWSWKGSWKTTNSSRLSGGTQKWSKVTGSEGTLSFDGTAIAIVGRRASWYGKSKVYLDGAYKGTVDQYSKSLADKQSLWSSQTLSPGRHTLRIVVTGTRNPSSSGSTVGIDSVRVTGQEVLQ